MSANDPSKLAPIPEDVLTDAESRLRRGKGSRDATKEKIKNKDFRNIDKPGRLRARVGRVLGDPASVSEAMRVTGRELESLGADDDVPDSLLERIIGGVNFVGVRFFDLGQRAARAIVRVDIRTPDGRTGSGTGSLVSSRLLLTNNHVLESKEWAQNSTVVFDFEDDLDNRPRPTVVFPLDPNAFFFTNKQFDFTLVAVKATAIHPGGASLSSYGFNPLDGSEGKVAIGEPINIIQHPSGNPKLVVLQENRLLDLPEDPPGWLHYESDTMPGSSGAPLFNNRWEMIGLHHSGWPERDDQGRILAVNGQLWTRDMGELAVKWLGNEGARVSQILQIVEAARNEMNVDQRSLVSELLSPPKTGSVVVPPDAKPPQPEPIEIKREVPPDSTSLPTGQSGVSITLPLHITVSLGTQLTTSPASTPVVSPVVTGPDLPVLPPMADPTSTERADSLREFTEAVNRPYFDAAADQLKQTEYYGDTNLDNSVSSDDLFNALSKLLASTHQNRLPYKPARHLYPWIDLHPDRKLRSLYTTDIYEPEQLIEESFAAEAKFEALLESLLVADGGEGALPLLEAGPAYNCEHVVPRSWFKGPLFGIAEGDLHHLFTCHVGCNSFRGNVPYWDFPNFEETVMEGCGRKEESKFEPTRGKGAAARAVLYFLLRYPHLVDDTISELQSARLATLINWHQQDPVEEYERHRNAAIHEKQGNRNPLIDFPELAGRINFANGLAT